MITSLIKVGILSLISFGSNPFSVCAPDYSESVAHIESAEFTQSTLKEGHEYWVTLKDYDSDGYPSLNPGDLGDLQYCAPIHSALSSYAYFNVSLSNGDYYEHCGIMLFGLTLAPQATIYHLANVVLNTPNQNYTLWNYESGVVDSIACAFKLVPVTDVVVYSDLFDVFEFGELATTTFRFYENINYNAPYNVSINDMLVRDSDFAVGDNPNLPLAKQIKYHMPFFEVNGQFYDVVGVSVTNAYGTRYKNYNDEGSYPINNKRGYGYVNHLYYENSLTGSTYIWAYRLYTSYTDANGDIQTALDRGLSITNSSYRNIIFISQEPNVTQENQLAQFNNANIFNGFDSNSVPLGQAFNLITYGLGALTGFFNIAIMPGITLGMLVLLPFAITIILFIVSLFKR